VERTHRLSPAGIMINFALLRPWTTKLRCRQIDTPVTAQYPNVKILAHCREKQCRLPVSLLARSGVARNLIEP
jgi:hypothetical protein